MDAWWRSPDTRWGVTGDAERVDDVLDVWFDSGCVPALVGRSEVVVEGVDQFRGWFQSCLWVAAALGFAYLDSGALYRLTALAAQRAQVAWDDEAGVAQVAAALDVVFSEDEVLLAGVPVGDAIRTEEISSGASQVAALPAVRAALLFRQRTFNTRPGLVGDGRDMGSVVFPQARLKVFLTASAQVRAERRYKQLIEKGFSANLPTLLAELQARDARDQARPVAPLRQEADAFLLDTDKLSIEQAVAQVLAWFAAASRQ